MEQLQSLYRGDNSDSLSNIMGMNYQPQMATSQMANTALSSGMSAGAQIKATAMNNDAAAARNWSTIQSQQMMERNRLAQANRQFSLDYALRSDAQLFGQQKDVATFNENKRATGFREEMDLLRYNQPILDKKEADDKEKLGVDAEWDVIGTELDSIEAGLDPIKDAGKIASLKAWRSKLQGWRAAPNSLSYLRAFQKSRTSNPMFGLISTPEAPAPKVKTGMG